MNTLRLSIAAALMAVASLFPILAEAPKVGGSLPDLSQFGLEGTLPDMKGKVVLVDFWASWCGPCRHSFPALQEIHNKYKDKGVVVLGISLDESKSDMDGFIKKMKVPFPVVRDAKGKLADQLSVASIPTSILVSGSGKILAIHNGYGGDKTKQEYIEGIEKALSAK